MCAKLFALILTHFVVSSIGNDVSLLVVPRDLRGGFPVSSTEELHIAAFKLESLGGPHVHTGRARCATNRRVRRKVSFTHSHRGCIKQIIIMIIMIITIAMIE